MRTNFDPESALMFSLNPLVEQLDLIMCKENEQEIKLIHLILLLCAKERKKPVVLQGFSD